MVFYIENPKVSTNKLLELLSSVSLQNSRPICENQLYFYTLVMNNPNNSIYNSMEKNKFLGINLIKKCKIYTLNAIAHYWKNLEKT